MDLSFIPPEAYLFVFSLLLIGIAFLIEKNEVEIDCDEYTNGKCFETEFSTIDIYGFDSEGRKIYSHVTPSKNNRVRLTFLDAEQPPAQKPRTRGRSPRRTKN